MARSSFLKPIIPKKSPIPTRTELLHAVGDGMDVTAKRVITMLNKTTKTWAGAHPIFSVLKANQYFKRVGTTDELWNMLNDGTVAHMIRPKTKKRLFFKTGGSPKTKVRTLSSYQGKPGTTDAVSLEVHHPGTEAREWTVKAAEEAKPFLRKDLQAKIDAVVERRHSK